MEPKALIDAPLVKTETAKSVVRTVKKLAADASALIIATDYDREGELIGLEALNLALEENPKLVRDVRRARFSALTPGEIKRAFSHLDHLSEPLARAGEARQDIDLIWGATLTRFVSLATSRLGSQFLSVGRVQTPTLVLVAEREKERRAFVSEPFWVVKVDLDADGQTLQRRAQGGAVHRRSPGDGGLREAGRPGPGHRRQADLAQGAAAGSLQHHQLHQRRHLAWLRRRGGHAHRRRPLHVGAHQLPPYRQHGLSVVARPARGAGDPGSGRVPRARPGALLARPTLHPSRGDKRTTDHPPIYPTGSPRRGELGDREWRLYELVARRFMATLADEAVMESNRVDLELERRAVLRPGQPGGLGRLARLLPLQPAERLWSCPCWQKGDLVQLVDKQLDAKETQPPSRYGQGPLIELMEKHNLGTKATRHAIIQNLYDRGYVHGNPVEPTEMGIKMAEALQEFAPRIASPEMTAELEKDMDLISERDLTKEQVVTISRDLLRQAYSSLEQNREQMAAKIYEGITDDRILGDCPKCGNESGSGSSAPRRPRSVSWVARDIPTAIRPTRCPSGATSSAPGRSVRSAAVPR